MRRLKNVFVWSAACLLLLAAPGPVARGTATPAQTSLTVSALDQRAITLRQESDSKAARELAGLKLTERASAADLARWTEEFPGNRARKAILALVDAAALLRPNAAQMDSSAPPDAFTQQQIVVRMVDYVVKTMPKMPNFSALRSTTGFMVATENQLTVPRLTPGTLRGQSTNRLKYHRLGPAKANGIPNANLYSMGSSAEVVTYRNGHEVSESSNGTARHANSPQKDLETSGEFGAILRMVIGDAPRENILWDHWEKGPSGLLAVFHYKVPSNRSEYGVHALEEREVEFPAYHGEIAVDPAKGTVMRISAVAMTTEQAFVVQSSILVEFGPTEIGGMTYFCPIHSVATARYFDMFADPDSNPPPLASMTSMNDVTFTNYHVFRTESHIVP